MVHIEMEFVAHADKLAETMKRALDTVCPALKKLIEDALKLNDAEIVRRKAMEKAQNK